MDQRRQVVFVDTTVTGWEALVTGLGTEVEVVLLDPAADGLAQIAAYLSEQIALSTGLLPIDDDTSAPAAPLYDAVHILSHGSAGHLYLGSTDLSADSLDDHQAALQQIGAALSDDADLLLYGCNLADGTAGEQLISALAAAIGADVAASTDLTGASNLGGDWELEAKVGAIETTSLAATDAPVLLAGDNYAITSSNLWSIMALMSQAAYGSNDTVRNNLLGSSAWMPIDLGSTLDGDYDVSTGRYESSSIFASAGAFITYSGSSAVIAFEGSGNISEDPLDWFNNLTSMFPHLSELLPLIDAFDQFVAANGITKVYVTGHSLGGSLAQAYMMAHPNGGVTYESVTFAAPGFNFGLSPADGNAFRLLASNAGSQMAQMPDDAYGLAHDGRVLQLEVDGDPVPDLPLAKIGDTIHLHGDGLASTQSIPHAMDLYQQAVELIDQEIAGEKNFAAGSTVLFGARYTDGQYVVGPLNDNLTGSANREYIVGGAGNDSLGGPDASQIYGGSPPYANHMYGGTGSDTYYVDHVDDAIHESSAPDGGADSVWSSLVNYTLPANVENLFLLPKQAGISLNADLHGTGNALNNTLQGNEGHNILKGEGGDDLLRGGLGSNTLDGGAGFDMVDYSQFGKAVDVGLGEISPGIATAIGDNSFDDTLVDIEGAKGTRGNDSFTGNSQDNFFELMGGDDYVDGRAGNDWASYGEWSQGVTIDLSVEWQNGNGRLISVENVWGSSYTDWLYGNAASNYLRGGSGADYIQGYGGEDFLSGNKSGDTFYFGAVEAQDARTGIVDTIEDYNRGNSSSGQYFGGEGDVIDLSGAIAFVYPTLPATPLSELVRAERNADNSASVYLLDTDASWLRVANLTGVTTGNTLKLLLASGQPVIDLAVTGSATAALPTWSISPASTTVTEGNTSIDFVITRSSALTQQDIYISTTINKGSINQGDYQYWLNEKVTFAVGQTSHTATVHINDDSTAEGNETFGLIVQYDPDAPASHFEASATFTIIDEDVYVDPGAGETWTGTSSSETKSGTSGHDSFYGNGGNDTLYGNGGNDGLTGGSGDDYLSGGDGNDNLTDYDGDDTLLGGSGNDLLHSAGGGADVINGGSGIDTLYLNRSDLTAGIAFAITADGNGNVGAFSLPDGTTVRNVELLQLTTGSGDDRVTFANTLIVGHQFWDGGDGNDSAVLDFSAHGTAVTAVSSSTYQLISASAGIYNSTTGYPIHVTLKNVENLTLFGGSGNDSLWQVFGTNRLVGNDGDDSLISGSNGDDILEGGAGNDWLTSHGGGADDIDGGSGIDTLSLNRSDLTAGIAFAITADGNGNVGAFSLPDGTTVRNVELLSLTTGSGDDRVTFANTLIVGHQSWDGGDGNDSAVLDFSAQSEPVTGFATSGAGYLVRSGTYDNTTQQSPFQVGLRNVENITLFGGSGNDSLWRDFGNNRLVGNDGDDSLISTSNGDDILEGGAGNDSLSAASGNNALDGGAGDDRLTSTSNGDDILEGGAGDDRLSVSGGGADDIDGGSGIDTLFLNRSDLTAGVAFAITADGNGNVGAFSLPDGTTVRNVELLQLTTGSGDDRVTFVNTTLDGYLQWDGGDGNDSAVLDFSGHAQTVNGSAFLNGDYWVFSSIYDSTTQQYPFQVHLTNVENITLFGGSGNDSLWQDFGNNRLVGNDGDDSLTSTSNGDDILEGGAGNDWLSAASGNDVLDGGAGDDGLSVSGGGADDIDGGSGIDTLSLNRSDLTAGVAFAITADGNGNVGAFSLPDGTTVRNVELLQLATGSGDDSVTFANTLIVGQQYWDGGDGNDSAVLDFSAQSGPVTGFATSGAGYLVLSGTYNDTTGYPIQVGLTNVENLTLFGGSGNDYLSKDFGNNRLVGNDGDDSLTSTSSGDDILEGGAGNDSLSAGGGNDVLDGGTGDDALNGGEGDDTLSYSGAATITGGAGRDTIILSVEAIEAGNTAVTVQDFQAGADGDLLNLTAVIARLQALGMAGDDPFAAGWLRVVDTAPGAAVEVDLTGAGNGAQWQTLAVLRGVVASSVTSQNFVQPVDPANQAPSGSPTAVLPAGAEDVPYVITAASLLAGFSDVDGDTLSVANLSADHGTLVDNLDGSWTFTPTGNYHGPVTLDYQVSDGQGGSVAATQGFTLAPVNDAPTGAPAAALPNGAEDTPYGVSLADLLSGFVDIDGDVLGVTSLAADRGSLVDNGNGTWTLTPEANYHGAVTLNYQVVDGQGGSVAATQSLTLAPVNDAPTVSLTPPPQTATEDAVFSFTVPEDTFADADAGDTLTLSARRADGTALPAWLTFNAATRTFSGTPTNADVGTLSLRLTATDVAGAAVSLSFVLTVLNTNDVPLATPDTATTSYNTAVSINVLTNDSDVDVGDTLTVSTYTQPTNGSVTLDSATGLLVYTPRNSWFGTDTFAYTASDGNGGLATAEVSVTVAAGIVGNDAANVLSGTRGADTIDGRGGDDVITALAGNDWVVGGEGNDQITGGSGADVLDGGPGDDWFLVAGFELTGDTIQGGTGNDTLVFTGNVTLTGGFAIHDVEQLDMAGQTLTVKTTDRVDLSGMTLQNGGLIAGDGANNTIIGSQGADTLNGRQGGDVLVGGAGGDVLYGGSGADSLAGGAGNDTLYGGSTTRGDRASDLFDFDTALDASTNVDRIVAFEANGFDKINLDPAIFDAFVGGATTGVDAGEFRAGAGVLALDVDDLLLFDTANGNLYYDADGSGAGAQVQFGTMVSLVGVLDHTDFSVASLGLG